MGKARKMPSEFAIWNYWEENFPESLNDGQIVRGQCWACGSTSLLQRCHIIPKWQGGEDSVENLHLLCKVCHNESENLTGADYWKWYQYKLVHDFDFGYKKFHNIAVAYGYVNPEGGTTEKGKKYLAKIKGISIEEVESIL